MIIKTALEIRAGGTVAALTRSQSGLAATPARVFSRHERTAGAHVQNARAELGDDPEAPRWIVTVAGAGCTLGARPDG